MFQDPNTDSLFVYTMQDGKQVRKPFVGSVDQLTAKTEVKQTMEQKAEGKFLEGMAGVDVKRVENTMAAADAARTALTSLNELDKLTENDLISGPYAGPLVGATNLLNQLGLLSKNDTTKLSSSEIYQKSAKDLVLAGLNGKLGGGTSNKDVEFIAGIVPQLETSPEARKKLVTYLTKRNIKIIDEADRMEEWARTHNSLRGFKSELVIPKAGNDAIRSQLEALKRERAAAAAREGK